MKIKDEILKLQAELLKAQIRRETAQAIQIETAQAIQIEMENEKYSEPTGALAKEDAKKFPWKKAPWAGKLRARIDYPLSIADFTGCDILRVTQSDNAQEVVDYILEKLNGEEGK